MRLPALAALAALLVVPGAMAAEVPEKLQGLDLLWWGEDEAGESPDIGGMGLDTPMPAGGDIQYLAAARNGTDLMWYVAFQNTTYATGDNFYQVFWSKVDDPEQYAEEWSYVTAAEVSWVNGEVVRVAPSDRGNGRVGTPTWDAERQLLVFRVRAAEHENTKPTDYIIIRDVDSGPTLGISGLPGGWDSFYPENATFQFSSPPIPPVVTPTPPPRVQATQESPAVALPLLLLMVMAIAWRYRRL